MKMEPFKMEVTPEQSRQVQEIVFKNGGAWACGAKTEKNTNHPFLIYDKDQDLRFGIAGSANYPGRPEPQITFAEFMARYGGEETTQFDIMRKIVAIAEEAHKNGCAGLCSVLLFSLADYISNNAHPGIKPTKK